MKDSLNFKLLAFYCKEKAFTLVELIVVIIILAILGLISFIYLQGFTIDSRDAKRISDVKNLITKITIENGMGIDYSQIIGTPEKTILKINGIENKEGYQSIKDPINRNILKENGDNFKDPTNDHPYPFAFAEGNAGGVGYSFIQLAYVEEKTGVTRLVGNYYEMQPGDSPSLFVGCLENPDEKIKDAGCPLYDPEEPFHQSCRGNPNLNGYNVPTINYNETTKELEKLIAYGKIKTTFTCKDGEFKQNEETQECSPRYGWNGTICELRSCPAGQAKNLNGTECEDVGYGNYSPEGDIEMYHCPLGGITEITTAASITDCKKLDQACTGLPNTTAYLWHSTNVNQIWNGSERVPSLVGTYSATAVSGQCVYGCKDGYSWVNNSCRQNSCADYISGNGTFYSGEPTSPDTGWQTINSLNPCYVSCNTGYSLDGNMCKINTYTLTVNPGGNTYTQNYDTTITITAPTASYTVSYYLNGGTSTIPSPSIATRPFNGWTLSGGGNILSNSSTTTYRFGTSNGTLTASYGTVQSVLLPGTPTRSGYSFDGWYMYNLSTKIGNAGTRYTPTQSETLYAKWTPTASGADGQVASVGTKYRAKANRNYLWSGSSVIELKGYNTYFKVGATTHYGHNVTRSGSAYPAFQACINMGSGWRLPTINELISLFNNNGVNILNLGDWRYRSSTGVRDTKTEEGVLSYFAWAINSPSSELTWLNKVAPPYSIHVVCIHD